MRILPWIPLLFLFFAGTKPPEPTCFYLKVQTAAELKQFLRWSPDRIPLISAHRGGPAPGFPENCIATFENTLRRTYAIIELDVRPSKDDSLMLMHDERVDRTTNGTGLVRELTYAQLKSLYLKDPLGNLTRFRIPSLTEALQWGWGKTVLKLDPKRNVSDTMVVQHLQRFRSQAYTLVITYTTRQAATYYHLDSSLILSVNIRQKADLQLLSEAGIPYENMLAFTGTAEPADSLYRQLHQRGISCILATIGKLDQKAQKNGPKVYRRLLHRGADVLATDYPAEAAQAVKRVSPRTSSKSVYVRQ